MMIDDNKLAQYLQQTMGFRTEPLNMHIIGNQGEHLLSWQMRFNFLPLPEMYNEFNLVVNQLMLIDMDERQRMHLFKEVLKIGERLIANLQNIYKNQVGFLNDVQQQALDSVISIYYEGIMFYHTVWQRVAVNPIVEPEKTGVNALLSAFSLQKKEVSATDTVIQQCVHGMMTLLKRALFEKHLGYRRDTQVIWQYLNSCYMFLQMYGWLNVAVDDSQVTFRDVYHQCVLSEVIDPYACRRPDMLMLQHLLPSWTNDIRITTDLVEQPYLFINLLKGDGLQILNSDVFFNPFAPDAKCLFVSFGQYQQALIQLINSNVPDDNQIMYTRCATIALNNLQHILTPSVPKIPVQQYYQASTGFNNIHYMVANRSSLGNLIQARTLPEVLRPNNYSSSQLNKSIMVMLKEKANHDMFFEHELEYDNFEPNQLTQISRSVEPNPINQLQVQSLVVLREVDDMSKNWLLGQISYLQQMPKRDIQYDITPTIDNKIGIVVNVCVKAMATGLVPCGVRLFNADSRPINFVQAFIVPQNPTYQRTQTTLLMARFGYHIGDKLIIRIDSKEVLVQLTELVMLTDDVEEYVFARMQH